MNKTTLTLSLLAAATLAACGSPAIREDTAQYVSPVTNSPVRAGRGKVVYLMDPTGPVNGVSWQRMTLAMDDGSSQIIDRQGRQVAWGEQLRVRDDSTFKRDPNTTKASP